MFLPCLPPGARHSSARASFAVSTRANNLMALAITTLKPVLNWANVSLRTELEVFGKASWFLIGPTFLREPSWKYLSKLYSGSKKLCSTCSGNIHPIRRTLPLILLSSPVDEEEIKIKMDDGVARFFTCSGGIFLIC